MVNQNQHSKRTWPRLVGVAVLVLWAFGTVTACDLTDFLPGKQATVSKDTQEYSQFGVTAQLPGTGWNISPISNQDTREDAELATSNDKLLVFSVEQINFMGQDNNYLNYFLETFAGSYASTSFEYKQPVEIASADFHGFRAQRIQGTRGSHSWPELTEDYKFIQYIFVVKSQIYVVGAGVKLSKWDNSTKAVLDSILDTVTIR